MAMTMTQKILASHAGLDSVSIGQLISCRLDLVMGNDITAPVAINEFNNAGFDKVFDKNRIALVMDHFTPCKDIKSAQNCAVCRDFAKKYNIERFYDVGRMGIEHALLPEQGLVTAGDCVIGADSHTCTYGALGAFSTGIGSTDMAAGMATGRAWFKVPPAIRINLTGTLPGDCCGKDVILTVIGILGVDGALYRSMEFTGEGLSSLSMDDRFTIANMTVEAGAKNGIFDVDGITLDYIRSVGAAEPTVYKADDDAVYERTVDIDLSQLEPCVAAPHLPSNVIKVSELEDVRIDQAVIGSCTNGRLSDMRAAAEILKGRHIADGVRCIVIPATQKIYLECVKEGLAEIFVTAGCVFSTPTCGPCLGGHMGVLAENETAVATTNRNFVGRMGHTSSKVYLASPYVAAASAIEGKITVPRRKD